MKSETRTSVCFRGKRERGMTLVELMVAMLVLAVGLGALTTLFAAATLSNNRNRRDTSGTLLAKWVLEQISGQHPNPAPSAPISDTDCAGNVWTIATAGGAAPAGAGATLVANAGSAYYGLIDQTQAYANIPVGYAMRYTDCGNGNGGRQAIYEVRWNVMTISPFARLITVSARQSGPTPGQLGTTLVAYPVTVRGIGGP